MGHAALLGFPHVLGGQEGAQALKAKWGPLCPRPAWSGGAQSFCLRAARFLLLSEGPAVLASCGWVLCGLRDAADVSADLPSAVYAGDPAHSGILLPLLLASPTSAP